MDGHERLLAAFLAGDLDGDTARRWDEHLLECESCWCAVREDRVGRQAGELLRQPAPAGLSDRVRFAVELTAAGATSRRLPRGGVVPGWRRLTAAGALALGLTATLLVLLPGGRTTMPAPVAAVARYAQTVPSAEVPGSVTGLRTAPVEVGHPVTITVGGQRIVMRTWRLGGTEAVVAVSSRAFPMPPGAQGAPGGGMAWSARVGNLSLYCINGRTSELVAAAVPAAELAQLAAQLPLA